MTVPIDYQFLMICWFNIHCSNRYTNKNATSSLHSLSFQLDMYKPKELMTSPDLHNAPYKGKVLMKDWFGLAFLRLHTIHPLPISLITQNLCPIADDTYSAPKWEISWYCRISSFTTWCLPGSINWCFAELWMSAFYNLPLVLVIPDSSRNSANLRSLLFFDNGWFIVSAGSSVPNSSCWIHFKCNVSAS